MPETGIGLFPDVGGSFFMPKLKDGLGMYLALTGYRLKGGDVAHAGIATHMCNQDRIEGLKDELLNLNAACNIEEVLNKYDTQFTKDNFTLTERLPDIAQCFTKGSVENILECLHNNANDEWAKKTADNLKTLSPTSVKITFEQMKRGKSYSTLKECLEMEYRLACRCCEDSDFYEGVRALLVDKDMKPVWKPETIEMVSQEIINRYFSNLPTERELKL